MPYRIKKVKCKKCGVLTNRRKYCAPCAEKVKIQRSIDFNKQLYSQGRKIERPVNNLYSLESMIQPNWTDRILRSEAENA